VKLCSFEKKVMRSKVRKMVMDYVEAPILFKNYKSDNATNVLELGCGAGYGTRNILQSIQPKRLIATDYDLDLVEFARRNTREYMGDIDVDFCQADATNLQYDDNSFDIVVSIGILHHILNYKEALGEMFRVLKPGGVLLLEEVMKEAHFWPIGKLLVPAVLFNDSEFIGAVEEQGFSVKMLGRYMKAFILLECRKETLAIAN
jgi:ubiquinone/menaquinone biosynthesis C-methylase UbiE